MAWQAIFKKHDNESDEGITNKLTQDIEPVPVFSYTQLYEEKLREGQKSTKLQFYRVIPTKNCTFAILILISDRK